MRNVLRNREAESFAGAFIFQTPFQYRRGCSATFTLTRTFFILLARYFLWSFCPIERPSRSFRRLFHVTPTDLLLIVNIFIDHLLLTGMLCRRRIFSLDIYTLNLFLNHFGMGGNWNSRKKLFEKKRFRQFVLFGTMTWNLQCFKSFYFLKFWSVLSW